MLFTRENLKLSVVAAVCLLIGLGGPAVAAQVRATFADNAGAVDGFSAVGAGATVTQRKGKLVATNATTGRLPDNIIATAPNAAKLGGFTLAQLRYLDLPTTSGVAANGATVGPGDVRFASTGGLWAIGFRVPPDHPTAAPITLELDYGVEFSACAWYVETVGALSTVGGDTVSRQWFVSGTNTTGDITVPAVAATVFRHTFRLSGTVAAGTTVKLLLYRLDQPSDTCGEVILRSALVRY